MRSKTGGFTLLELMIVVVVIAILAAFAIPNYLEYVHKGRRSDALRALSELQLSLERWRAENPCYGQSGVGGCPTFTASGTYPVIPTAATSPYYEIALPTTTATGYSLTAAPRAGSAQAGDRCGTYTFTMAAGVLTKSASGGNAKCSL